MASGGDQSGFISLHNDGGGQGQYSNAGGGGDFSYGGGWRGNRGSGPYRGRGGRGGNNWRGGQSSRGYYQQPRGNQWHRGGRSGPRQQPTNDDFYNEQAGGEQFDVKQYYSPAMVQNPWAALERQRSGATWGAEPEAVATVTGHR